MRNSAVLALVFAAALASAAPPEATNALTEARAQARRDGKNVMVVFHASWCGWCKKFDAMLNDPTLKPSFEKSYVVVHLDVLERGEKKSLENPGGGDTMASLGGKDAGLPFFAVLSPDGKKLADSLITPGNAKTNTGHPAQPNEIAHFIELLKATAPKMGERGREGVASYLRADAAKR